MTVNFRLSPDATFDTDLASGKKIVVRGSNAEDETHTVTLFGLRDGGSVDESETLTIATGYGMQEKMSAYAYEELKLIHFGGTFDGSIALLQEGGAGHGDVRVDTNPSDAETLQVGLTGLAVTYRFKNTLAAAYDVKIGATAADTADNLKKAINADGTPGTHYYAGTLANPFCTATVSTQTVTITDNCACERQLAWVLSQSASSFSLRVPSCGADGIALGSLANGTDQRIGQTQIFDSADLSETTWLHAVDGDRTDAVAVGGKPYTILFSSSGGSGTVVVDLEYSWDGETWFESVGGYSPENVISIIGTDAADAALQMDEPRAEFVRLKITDSNRTNWTVDAKATFG